MSKKLKLLFLTNDFAAGGVQRIIADFANELHGDIFDVEVATLLDRPRYFFTRDQLRNDIVFTNFHFKKFWDIAGWYRLYRYIKRKRFDIVFTQLFMADFFGRTAAWLAHTPLIVTEIQNLIPNLPKKYIFVDRLLRHITDACFSFTPTSTNYIQHILHYPPKKIIEIPSNSVDEKRFKIEVDRAQMRRALGVPECARLIVSVGRLIEQKGHTVLLKALPTIRKEIPSAHVVIVGEGNLELALKTEAEELGIADHVTFAGVRKDVPSILKSADVFAFPSLYEGQGIILFEAMFSRLPIVASNVGGIPDVIKPGETGLLSTPGDVMELARALVRMLTDEPLRAHVREEALRRYGDRTLTNSATTLVNILVRLYRQKL